MWIPGRRRRMSSAAERGGAGRRFDLRQGAGARRGFALLESLVALALTGLVVVGAIEMLSAGLRADRAAAHHLEAVSLAEWRLGQMELLPLDSIESYEVPRRGQFSAPFAGYAWRALARREPGSPTLLRAAVLVEWEGREYSLETTFYRPDLDPNPLRRRR